MSHRTQLIQFVHPQLQNLKCIYELLQAAKLKLQKTKVYNEKISLLTLAPQYWSIEKTASYFGITKYMVRESRRLLKERGFLAERDVKATGIVISDIVKQCVVDFYESEENSRMLPGKKDCVSIQTEEGKEKRQKMLVLSNLKELYESFKNTHPDMKIGFSSFASLRPKWCVLAGVAGTHTVCVCVIHQNPKLKIQSIETPSSMTELMAKGVCSIDNQNCMMHNCENCPGMEAIAEELENTVQDNESIQYQQWISTDHCALLSIQQPRMEFIPNLASDLYKLTSHHFISKAQSRFLREAKEALQPEEAIVQLDYSENFTVVMQDAIQSSYFSGRQATVHPYVIYYRKVDEPIQSKSYCIISNHMTHDSTAVSVFNEHIVAEIKKDLPWVMRLHYWSDGSAAQYKNR